MTRTQGTSHPRSQDTEPPAWEPEPLHLPLYLPVAERTPAKREENPDPPSRVIIIDLA